MAVIGFSRVVMRDFQALPQHQITQCGGATNDWKSPSKSVTTSDTSLLFSYPFNVYWPHINIKIS